MSEQNKVSPEKKHDYLFQYFYIFGTEPDTIELSDFNYKTKNYLDPEYLKLCLLSKYPPIDRPQSNIDERVIMNHCFPKGYKILSKQKKPPEEYFNFKLNNLMTFFPNNKYIYFTCVILFEPLQAYLDITKQKLPSNLKEDEKIPINDLYIQKAICFSSFEAFPEQVRNLCTDLISYVNTKKVTIPIEKIMENIFFGIPRPLRGYLYVQCTKNNEIIPKLSKDIVFQLNEYNKYNFSSYNYNSILHFEMEDIVFIYNCLLLEIPILFFGTKKELITNIVESFLSLLHPFEYQYPNVSLLPDNYLGIIEMSKSFVFGINHKWIPIKDNEKNEKPKFFQDNNLNLFNKFILICDTDGRKNIPYINSIDSTSSHIVNFNEFGVYNINNNANEDKSQLVSDEINSKNCFDIKMCPLPERYKKKLQKYLSDYTKKYKDDQSRDEYNPQSNEKIGARCFYNFLASILADYHNYLYNTEEEVKKVCNEFMVKNLDDINIESIFNANKFLHDNKNDELFYKKFFETRLFKDFLRRKYLNKSKDKIVFLHFDETIAEKKNEKVIFGKKIKLPFINSKDFGSPNAYSVQPTRYFSHEEMDYINSNKDLLFSKYYQIYDKTTNEFQYVIFPKLTYDNKYFGKKNKEVNLLTNTLYQLIDGYKTIKKKLNDEQYYKIYKGDLTKRFSLDFNKLEVPNLDNDLLCVWIILFCLTFYYCDKEEKSFRCEDLLRKLVDLYDVNEKLISILIETFRKFGDETMLIKLFESIKNVNYAQYCCLCSMFKSDTKINYEAKEIVIGSTLSVKYYRDPKADDKVDKLPEDFNINLIKLRTFGGKNNKKDEKEKISIESIICSNCKNVVEIISILTNLSKKSKVNWIKCPKCNETLKPNVTLSLGDQRINFDIYSPKILLNTAKDIVMDYGVKIDLDELKTKYKDFFWSCVLYFYFNGKSVEMLFKYKDDIKNDNKFNEQSLDQKSSKNIDSKKNAMKKKIRGFKGLKIDNQKTCV